MLSIDRVKENALSLFGRAIRVDSETEKSLDTRLESQDFDDSVFSSDPLTPVFDAVETALRKAGYLDS